MKKLLLFPAVIFAVGAVGSISIATHGSFVTHDNGLAALHLIFFFTDTLASALCFAVASDY